MQVMSKIEDPNQRSFIQVIKMVRSTLFISAIFAMVAFVAAVPGDAALLDKIDITDVNVISPNNILGADKTIKSGNGNHIVAKDE
ncbi:hypothetical protein A0J61_08398 [Choanephora cucurbitarum]|uniref:Uncharacterized protein n=1 Tax=Choanephora cucurbitarum TaxID=101091 RepID=A0A1C7N3E1_9FUNG|nr:hypothetical protein A0J61_08398 [Choanephora cucurbitarum]